MSNSNNFDFLKNYGQEIIDEEAYFEQQFETLLTNLKEKQNGQAQFHDEGGAKKIFSVEQQYAKRTIAQAFLKDDNANKRSKYHFIREALITSKLDHPNIVPVYDIGLDVENRPYFTMKMLAGENLGAILNKLHKNDSAYVQKFPLSVLLDIFLKTCNAIAYAHAQGILHLDIKPENIQINDYGEVILIDWGLAWNLNEENIWDDGLIKGTPGYMAPEQIRSETDVFSPLTDIYALGALLYSILTLKRPTVGNESKKQLQNVLLGELPQFETDNTSNIPPALKAVVTKAMSLDMSARYQSVGELIKEITDYQNGFATSAQEASFLTLAKLFYKRQKALCITAITALAVVIISVFMFINQLKENERLAIKGKNEVEAVLTELKESEKKRYEIAMKASEYLVKVQRDEQLNQDFEQAERSLENLTQLEIDNYEFWYELGRLKISRLDFDKAFECFEKTVDLGYGDYKYNQNFLNVARDFNQIVKERSLTMNDYQQLYVRMPYVQIRAYLCRILHQQYFRNLQETSEFIKFCVQYNFGSLDNFHVDIDRYSLNLDFENHKKVELLDFVSGLSINKLNLRNSSIETVLHFSLNQFSYLDISDTRIKTFRPIKSKTIIAHNVNLDSFSFIQNHCEKLELNNSKIDKLDLRKLHNINELNLSNSIIRSVKVPQNIKIEKLILKQNQKGSKSKELQAIKKHCKTVIYE